MPLRLALHDDWDEPPHPSQRRGHFVGRRSESDHLRSELVRKSTGSILISGPQESARRAFCIVSCSGPARATANE